MIDTRHAFLPFNCETIVRLVIYLINPHDTVLGMFQYVINYAILIIALFVNQKIQINISHKYIGEEDYFTCDIQFYLERCSSHFLI